MVLNSVRGPAWLDFAAWFDGSTCRDNQLLFLFGITLQEGDTLWFAGGLQAVAFLLKMRGLRHIDEKQTIKTNIDILERRLVQVRPQ